MQQGYGSFSVEHLKMVIKSYRCNHITKGKLTFRQITYAAADAAVLLALLDSLTAVAAPAQHPVHGRGRSAAAASDTAANPSVRAAEPAQTFFPQSPLTLTLGNYNHYGCSTGLLGVRRGLQGLWLRAFSMSLIPCCNLIICFRRLKCGVKVD